MFFISFQPSLHYIQAFFYMLTRYGLSYNSCNARESLATDAYTQSLPVIPSHGHIDFVGTVHERLDEDHGHFPYLVQIQSWAGRYIEGGIATGMVCCVVPPWKSQSIDSLRMKSKMQFVGMSLFAFVDAFHTIFSFLLCWLLYLWHCAGNLVGLYPDGQRKPQLCMLVTELGGLRCRTVHHSSSSTPFPSPRKRRLTTLTPAAGQKELTESQSPVKRWDDLCTIVILCTQLRSR